MPHDDSCFIRPIDLRTSNPADARTRSRENEVVGASHQHNRRSWSASPRQQGNVGPRRSMIDGFLFNSMEDDRLYFYMHLVYV
jgi:hypothetical protein